MLEEGESLKMRQNDMTSAFYLFKLPPCWLRFLAFNLVVNGSETGRDATKKFCLACQVLPMGWSPAVSVMKEVSQLLVESQGMPGTMQVMRHKPLPEWLVETIKQGKGEGRGWFHVYLDNFFSGEKVVGGEEQKIAEHLQAEVEQAWNRAGVLSSEKKKVTGSEQVQERGAQFDGDAKLLGVSSSRLLRLFQTTCVLLSKRRFPRKWLQVVFGRWVHVLQFRRRYG